MEIKTGNTCISLTPRELIELSKARKMETFIDFVLSLGETEEESFEIEDEFEDSEELEDFEGNVIHFRELSDEEKEEVLDGLFFEDSFDEEDMPNLCAEALSEEEINEIERFRKRK